MRIVAVGSGPAGMTAALLLARQGHDVILVDRDPGPVPGRAWNRVGVMQFHAPHGFRGIGRVLLLDRLPDVHQALLDAGGVVDGEPSVPDSRVGMAIRRSTLERAMWELTSREPGVRRVVGHADRLVVDGDRVTGAVVGGRLLPADLVVDTSGRAGKLTLNQRPYVASRDSGFAYACRIYQLRSGAEPGPGVPVAMQDHDGFQVMVFLHDRGTFTVLLVRRSDDRELAALRDVAAYEAAVAVVPLAATWTDPGRAVPVDRVRVGSGLVNSYRPQVATVRGLLAAGDAVCTTCPTGGRGLSLAMMSAARLADVVESEPEATRAERLNAWCDDALSPWVADHMRWEDTVHTRWAGRPLDPEAPVCAELLMAALADRPELGPQIGPYLAMLVGPAAMEPVRDEVRAMLRAGWRPAAPSGVTRDELAAVVRRTTAAAA